MLLSLCLLEATYLVLCNYIVSFEFDATWLSLLCISIVNIDSVEHCILVLKILIPGFCPFFECDVSPLRARPRP